MNQYAEISTLNQGSYGVVQLVRQLKTSRMYAAKRVSLALSSKAEVEYEIKAHSKVANYPRVAQLADNFYDAEKNEHVLIIEYCSGGDLHDMIARGHKPCPLEIKKVILQLLDTLEYCHEVGVCHRDIKPENIFLQRNGAIKLGDWGLASMERTCTDFGTGSDQYMAPECFDRTSESYDAALSDIWAVGIVLLNMLFGRTPFKEATERDPLFKDYASSRESLYDIFPSLTRDVFNALRFSLALNPEHRSITKMREAINSIRSWSADDELEEIERRLNDVTQNGSSHKSTPSSRESSPTSTTPDFASHERTRRNLLGETSPAKMVPVVHKPFRVPTAVARSLHSPTTNWDRRKMFTPPSGHFMRGSFKPGSYKHTMHLPRHLEQPELEASDAAVVYELEEDNQSSDSGSAGLSTDSQFGNRKTVSLERLSSSSSTSSTSSTSSYTQSYKGDPLDVMFSMDDDHHVTPLPDAIGDENDLLSSDSFPPGTPDISTLRDIPQKHPVHRRKISFYR